MLVLTSFECQPDKWGRTPIHSDGFAVHYGQIMRVTDVASIPGELQERFREHVLIDDVLQLQGTQ